MIKAIIFDLDGTLLNTIDDIHFVLNESLNQFGLPAVTLSQTKCFVGNGARRLIEQAVGNRPSETVEKVYKYYSKKFTACGNNRSKLYSQEEETLLKLKSEGIKLAIITNKPQRATERVYAKFLAKFGFYKVLGQTEYCPLKPNPSSTLKILDDLMLKKEECIFVGDGETDVLTAKAAGIKCISVLWGYRTKQQLEQVGANLFAENFSDIYEIIKNNFH